MLCKKGNAANRANERLDIVRWQYNHPDDDIPVEYKWMVFQGKSESIYEHGIQFYCL